MLIPGELCTALLSDSFRTALATVTEFGGNDVAVWICDVVTTRCTVYSTDETFGGDAPELLESISVAGVDAIG